MIITDLASEGGRGPSHIARRLIAEGADPEETIRVTRCGTQCLPDHPLSKWAGGGAVPAHETADEYPCIVARLNDTWRVITCKNGIQWIVQKRQGNGQWRGVTFHRTRDVLMRDARDANTRQSARGTIDPAAWEALAALPDHIVDWRKAGSKL